MEEFISNELTHEILNETITQSGIIIEKGSLVGLNQNGSVDYLFLKEDTLIKDFLFKKGTYFYFYYESSEPYHGILAIDTIYIPKNNALNLTYRFLKDKALYFHKNGNVEEAYSDILVVNYIFTFDLGKITFYENGLLKSFVSREPMELRYIDNEHVFTKEQSEIFLDYNNEKPYVYSATLKYDVYLEGFLINKNKDVIFYAGKSIQDLGRLDIFYTSRNTLIRNFPVSMNSFVHLHPNGNLFEFEIFADTFINHIMLKPDYCRVILYDNEKLESIWCTYEITIKDKKYPPRSDIHFDKYGEVGYSTEM